MQTFVILSVVGLSVLAVGLYIRSKNKKSKSVIGGRVGGRGKQRT